MDNETVQAIAKATESIAPSINGATGTIKKFVDSPLEEIGGLVADSLRRKRILNWVKFQPKLKKYMVEAGVTEVRATIPSRVEYDLIEAITREDDDELQNLWAQLTTNIINPNTPIDDYGWQIALLKQLSPLEISILKKIVFAPKGMKEKYGGGFPTGLLPEDFPEVDPNGGGEEKLPKAPKNVELAIWHLIGLGCVVDASAFNDGDQIFWINTTKLGRELIESCELRYNSR